jgi:hypothetical protein
MKEKPSQNKDDRSCRTWFLPKGGWKQIKTVLENKTNLETENWKDICNKDYVKEIENKVPHIFLSRSPLTFGHSQLVIPAIPGKIFEEANFYEIASIILVRALQTYETVFSNKDSPIHEEVTFSRLSESTYSYGNYVKTLLLRVSAVENAGEQYKVHLVPFLKSHQSECLKRFRAQHRTARPDKKGGLIGWLGDRETEVDKWEQGWPWPNVSHDDIANKVWNLPKLSNKLNKIWLSEYKSVVAKI